MFHLCSYLLLWILLENAQLTSAPSSFSIPDSSSSSLSPFNLQSHVPSLHQSEGGTKWLQFHRKKGFQSHMTTEKPPPYSNPGPTAIPLPPNQQQAGGPQSYPPPGPYPPGPYPPGPPGPYPPAGYYPYPGYPQALPGHPHQYPVIVVEEQRRDNTAQSCLAACWATLCCCCLLDALN